MFLGYQKDKIALVSNTREELENNKFTHFDRIEETAEEYVLYNGEYMLKADAEAAQTEAEKQAQKEALLAQLDTLDLKAIRALRAIQAGTGTEADQTKLAELEEQAEAIRQQIKELL